MAEFIIRDEEWIKEKINEGIENFLECEGYELVALIRSYVFRQIFISGCALNMDNEDGKASKIRIEIDVPVFEECIRQIENNDPRSVRMAR